MKPLLGLALMICGAAALWTLVTAFEDTIVASLQPASSHLGEAVSIEGNSIHPDISIAAQAVVPTRSTTRSVHASHGNRLVAVRFVFEGTGETVWKGGATATASLIDGQGLSYPSDPGFTSVKAGRVLPANYRVRPDQRTSGYLVFQVPAAADITQVRLWLGPALQDTVRWDIP